MISNNNLSFKRVTAVYQCLFEFLLGFLGIGLTKQNLNLFHQQIYLETRLRSRLKTNNKFLFLF